MKYHLSRTGRRAIAVMAGYLQRVPGDLGEAYELVYEFIRKGGKLPVYARWVEGEDQQA